MDVYIDLSKTFDLFSEDQSIALLKDEWIVLK